MFITQFFTGKSCQPVLYQFAYLESALITDPNVQIKTKIPKKYTGNCMRKKVGFYTLQRHPFIIWFANDGNIQSFQQLKSKQFFSFFFCDWHDPDFTGIHCARPVRIMEFPQLPVVLSGCTSQCQNQAQTRWPRKDLRMCIMRSRTPLWETQRVTAEYLLFSHQFSLFMHIQDS